MGLVVSMPLPKPAEVNTAAAAAAQQKQLRAEENRPKDGILFSFMHLLYSGHASTLAALVASSAAQRRPQLQRPQLGTLVVMATAFNAGNHKLMHDI